MIARRKVLLVEDDMSMQSALERLLHLAGFECTSYESAEKLLADKAGEAATCVVSDLKLPAMSGLELLTRLRARAGWPPFILITAFDGPGQREEAVQRGAAAYLVKPFGGTALLDLIRATTEPARPS